MRKPRWRCPKPEFFFVRFVFSWLSLRASFEAGGKGHAVISQFIQTLSTFHSQLQILSFRAFSYFSWSTLLASLRASDRSWFLQAPCSMPRDARPPPAASASPLTVIRFTQTAARTRLTTTKNLSILRLGACIEEKRDLRPEA